jgi:plasmid stabilization system protein ParE
MEDRRRIFDFIEKDDPRAAILVDDPHRGAKSWC